VHGSDVLLVIGTGLLFFGAGVQAYNELSGYEGLRVAIGSLSDGTRTVVTLTQEVLKGTGPLAVLIAAPFLAKAAQQVSGATDRDGVTLKAQIRRAAGWLVVVAGSGCALAGEIIALGVRNT
jgi:hypothetical protein